MRYATEGGRDYYFAVLAGEKSSNAIFSSLHPPSPILIAARNNNKMCAHSLKNDPLIPKKAISTLTKGGVKY